VPASRGKTFLLKFNQMRESSVSRSLKTFSGSVALKLCFGGHPLTPVPRTEATIEHLCSLETLFRGDSIGQTFTFVHAQTMWNERRLPRLAPEFYQGYAHVLWTHVVKDRRQDWLNTRFHGIFRETLLHTCARYHLGCARYVLMPDHFHLIWVGASQGECFKIEITF